MNSMRTFLRSYWIGITLTVVGAAAVACGGGGGGGSIPPTGGGPPPIVTPAPTATPTQSTASVTGQAVDESGAAISGATVSFGSGFSQTPGGGLTGAVATATTDSTGHFSATVTVGAASFAQVVANGHATAHKAVSLTAGANALAAWALPVPTANELNALAALNADRASQGSGAGAQPLTLDADMQIVARFRANDMAAQGYFAHVAPGQTVAAVDAKWQTLPNTLYVAFGPALLSAENIGAGYPSLTAAETAYVYQDAGSNNGHRNTVLSKGDIWAGFGEAYNGKTPAPGTGNQTNYFAETFVTTCGVACP